MKILVTGGTGTLGKHVVPMLRAHGADVAVLSRSNGDVTCDLLAGDVPQIDADVVVHLAGGQKGDDIATRNLLAACGNVRHFVYISVIGADTVPLAWLRTKLACEEAIAASGIPFSVLRAAQFHDLTLTMVRAMASCRSCRCRACACSRSTPAMSPHGSWNSRWVRLRAGWRIWPDLRSSR